MEKTNEKKPKIISRSYDARERVHDDGPWVYFLMCGSGKNAPVKIGFTTDLEERITDIQVGNWEDLTLIAAITGGMELEREIQSAFAADNIRGEWFRQTAELLETIEGLFERSLALKKLDSMRCDLKLSAIKEIIPKNISLIERVMIRNGLSLISGERMRSEDLREMVNEISKPKIGRRTFCRLVDDSKLPILRSKINGCASIKGIGIAKEIH